MTPKATDASLKLAREIVIDAYRMWDLDEQRWGIKGLLKLVEHVAAQALDAQALDAQALSPRVGQSVCEHNNANPLTCVLCAKASSPPKDVSDNEIEYGAYRHHQAMVEQRRRL